ncbi:MAG: hypothetical protein NTX46_00555 [Chloroflexi bacterium]|nr:hypothetical protein [Chloroflexota bacterium]
MTAVTELVRARDSIPTLGWIVGRHIKLGNRGIDNTISDLVASYAGYAMIV